MVRMGDLSLQCRMPLLKNSNTFNRQYQCRKSSAVERSCSQDSEVPFSRCLVFFFGLASLLQAAQTTLRT